ncbi:tetratricopeptide repeat protein [Brevundimonas sp.]|uniref:tetratricopeptide repeat protein n=1 Tax=Brevundimonas sp. TaxID=1871086 RepID=UPI002D746570|nr:tetratricopeptide repeat protein [Brevundimonas sp.]HYD27871.1 tetratricopeptide repeat protein [Brevundimonas sp.]
MSAVELSPEQIHAIAPTAQGVAGDSASPEAIRKLSHQLANPKLAVKAQRKALEKLKAALMAIRAGDFERGAQRAIEALKMDETSGLAWHVLAICREKSGDLGQALLAYEAALKLLPNETDVAHDLGRLAQQMGYLDIAEKLLLKYLAADPGHIEATNNLACVQRDQKRYGDAVETLRALLGVEPESPVLWNTLGTVLSDQGDMATALTFFEEALRHDPDFAKARYNRANARQPLGDALGALEDIDAALPGAESPYERAMMNMARAMLLMTLGRIPEGFEAYEVRLDPHLPEAMRVAVDAPRWDPRSEEIRGKRLLIVGEQGIADEMVFGTCIGDAIEAVGPEGQVYVAVEPRLIGLFQRAFPTAVVGGHRAVKLEGRITRYVPFAEELEGGVDAWIPMASLLAVYRPSTDAFPDRRGYLVPDPDKVAHWKAELEKLGPGLKVGLHWKSLVLTGSRARYFSSFERWRPVLTTPGAVMVNLQCGDVSDDLAAAEAAGVSIWTPPIDLKDDLEDVAALSKALDLVIGPGIAGTNLAAAVGGAAWMITAPDDWHYLATDKYPFYPHLRFFWRDSFADWEGAIARIRAALEEAVAEGSAGGNAG